MNWFKRKANDGNPRPKVITKQGFLIPHGGGMLCEATLWIYPNGVSIVKTWDGEYFSTKIDATTYEVNSCRYPKFVITE